VITIAPVLFRLLKIAPATPASLPDGTQKPPGRRAPDDPRS
jgi:hypothetical protein